MKEIDVRLRELGERMRGWAPNGGGLGDSAHRSIVRRRRATSLVGGAAASTLVVLSTLGVANLTEGEAKVPRAGAPATSGSQAAATGSGSDPSPSYEKEEKIARDEFFGSVWPEDARQETSQGCSAAAPDSFRADALGTALEFARVVLGWDDAHGVVGGEHRNSMQIELSRAGTGRAAVNASMVEYVPGCWSVQTVDVIPGGEILPITWDRDVSGEGDDQTNAISIGFDTPEGVRGRIELEYGDHVETRRFAAGDVSVTEPLVFSLGPLDPYDAGHAFILFEDEHGRVRTAVGVPLWPQKGGARADGLS